MIKSINFFNNLKLFDIIIIHLIFINSNNLELTSIKYPTTYVLLNHHIVLVTVKGLDSFLQKWN